MLATLAVCALVALQPPVNAELGRRSSDLAAAFFSVSVSFLLIGLIFLIFGLRFAGTGPGCPPIYLLGVYGAVFVAVSLVTVRSLEAGATIAALVCARLMWPPSWTSSASWARADLVLGHRPIGIAALILGTLLVTIR